MYSHTRVTINPNAPTHSMYFGAPCSAPFSMKSKSSMLDFDFIENGAEHGAPKYMEWVGAFGLMVTLVWLYIEILHLLAKLRD